MLVIILRIAKAPPDQDHHYGHDKAEYFANGVQGTLILIAAVSILVTAIERFLSPKTLDAGHLGLALAAAAGVINFLMARFLKAKAKETHSNALKGEASHLMSDVYTSAAVFVGVGLDFFTGLTWLDPLAALMVSVVILRTGLNLIRECVVGLMDAPLDPASQQLLVDILERYKAEREVDYHALRSRVAGRRTFVSVHILVPGAWSVKEGHDLLEELESEASSALQGRVTILTHLEPLEEECSFTDIELA